MSMRRQHRRGFAMRAEATDILSNLARYFPSLPTVGYGNDSWSEVAIGWWGGEP